MTTLWKVFCQEDDFPGLWQRWYRNQCVAVGWSADEGYKLRGSTEGDNGWKRACNALIEMTVGDLVLVALSGHRVGRIGQITSKFIEDGEWKPLVSKDVMPPYGDKGRRINVRWDLIHAPDSPDVVVKLPLDCRFTSGQLRWTISRVDSHSVEKLKTVMSDPSNWVGLSTQFQREKAIADYIANYPHHLEDGMLPYPDSKIRERVFKNRTRLDVLLIDKNDRAVIVECKQATPTVENITQLRDYMQLWEDERGEMPRGLLVHGGVPKLHDDLLRLAKQKPVIEIISYSVDVNFRAFAI